MLVSAPETQPNPEYVAEPAQVVGGIGIEVACSKNKKKWNQKKRIQNTVTQSVLVHPSLPLHLHAAPAHGKLVGSETTEDEKVWGVEQDVSDAA
jgi:hypothetical protein